MHMKSPITSPNLYRNRKLRTIFEEKKEESGVYFQVKPLVHDLKMPGETLFSFLRKGDESGFLSVARPLFQKFNEKMECYHELYEAFLYEDKKSKMTLIELAVHFEAKECLSFLLKIKEAVPFKLLSPVINKQWKRNFVTSQALIDSIWLENFDAANLLINAGFHLQIYDVVTNRSAFSLVVQQFIYTPFFEKERSSKFLNLLISFLKNESLDINFNCHNPKITNEYLHILSFCLNQNEKVYFRKNQQTAILLLLSHPQLSYDRIYLREGDTLEGILNFYYDDYETKVSPVDMNFLSQYKLNDLYLASLLCLYAANLEQASLSSQEELDQLVNQFEIFLNKTNMDLLFFNQKSHFDGLFAYARRSSRLYAVLKKYLLNRFTFNYEDVLKKLNINLNDISNGVVIRKVYEMKSFFSIHLSDEALGNEIYFNEAHGVLNLESIEEYDKVFLVFRKSHPENILYFDFYSADTLINYLTDRINFDPVFYNCFSRSVPLASILTESLFEEKNISLLVSNNLI